MTGPGPTERGATRKVRIVEDDEPVRASLCALLEAWDFEVETYHDGETFLAAPACDAACCILLDVRLPGIDGLSVLTRLHQRGNSQPVIVLTGHGDVAMAVRALKSGASDFIEKPYDDADLVRRIEDAWTMAHEQDPAGSQYRAVFAALTPRETEIMHDVVAGFSNKIIAHRRDLSPRTVEIHRARVMEKTGATSLSHLVRMALKAGIDPEAT